MWNGRKNCDSINKKLIDFLLTKITKSHFHNFVFSIIFHRFTVHFFFLTQIPTSKIMNSHLRCLPRYARFDLNFTLSLLSTIVIENIRSVMNCCSISTTKNWQKSIPSKLIHNFKKHTIVATRSSYYLINPNSNKKMEAKAKMKRKKLSVITFCGQDTAEKENNK